ncbi:MAG: hypothetical protein KDA24_12060, partial [Deltaproteobacteria bacterium]|nr:hypothetical protein [Deltaproteobacteria bacterium]
MSRTRWSMYPLLILLLLLPGLAHAQDDSEPVGDDDDSAEETDPAAEALADALRQAQEAAAAAEAARAEASALLDEARAMKADADAAAAAEAAAAEAAAAEAAAKANPPPATRATLFTLPGDIPVSVDLSGKYALWVLNQHGFFLGQDVPLDDADYVVQMLR